MLYSPRQPFLNLIKTNQATRLLKKFFLKGWLRFWATYQYKTDISCLGFDQASAWPNSMGA